MLKNYVAASTARKKFIEMNDSIIFHYEHKKNSQTIGDIPSHLTLISIYGKL